MQSSVQMQWSSNIAQYPFLCKLCSTWPCLNEWLFELVSNAPQFIILRIQQIWFTTIIEWQWTSINCSHAYQQYYVTHWIIIHTLIPRKTHLEPLWPGCLGNENPSGAPHWTGTMLLIFRNWGRQSLGNENSWFCLFMVIFPLPSSFSQNLYDSMKVNWSKILGFGP